MGLLGMIIHNKEAKELKEIILAYWERMEKFHKERIRVDIIDDNDEKYLALKAGTKNSQNHHYFVYYTQDEFEKVKLENLKRLESVSWSNFLHYGREYREILICKNSDFYTFLEMNNEFVAKFNRYIELTNKMDGIISGEIRAVAEKHTKWIEEFRNLKHVESYSF